MVLSVLWVGWVHVHGMAVGVGKLGRCVVGGLGAWVHGMAVCVGKLGRCVVGICAWVGWVWRADVRRLGGCVEEY